MGVVNKRVFDTDSALHATFDRYWGKWQIMTYLFFVLSYSIIVGWMNRLSEYTLLVPANVTCDLTEQLKQFDYKNRTIIQRVSGKSKYYYDLDNETSKDIRFPYDTSEYGETVATQFEILCDMQPYLKFTKFAHYLGFFIGSLLLGIASDKGGRKSIILACIWSAGIMSTFQLVDHDYVSFVFFQFFLGLFIGVSFVSK